MANHQPAQTPRFAYVGSRTTKERNARGAGITVYAYDAETGACTLLQILGNLINPSFLAFDHQQRHLYCVHGDQSEVSAFSIDDNNGRLTWLNTVSTHGKNPVHLSVDLSGRYLAVANFGNGSFALFPLDNEGRLGELADLQRLPGEPGPHRVEQVCSHPHMIPFDPSGRFVVIPDKGLDQVFVYRVQVQSGTPVATPVSSVKTREGSGPRHIVFAPNGRFAYVANELDSSVTAYAYDAQIGALKPLQILPTLPADFTGDSRAAAIVMAPSGHYLYVSNRGHDSVTTYALDASSGLLERVAQTASGGQKPRFMNLTPDGKFLFVANEDSDAIVAFDIDQDSGRLAPTEHSISTGSPVCMVFK